MQGIDITCEIKRRGWRQQDLADRIGISRQALWKVIHDKTVGGDKAKRAIEVIAEILNVRPQQVKDWYRS